MSPAAISTVVFSSATCHVLHCRVVVQNERYDNWTPTIIQLKKLFNEYPESVLKYHHRPDIRVPGSHNSTAAQGNFIEVLNMALNGVYGFADSFFVLQGKFWACDKCVRASRDVDCFMSMSMSMETVHLSGLQVLCGEDWLQNRVGLSTN